MKKRALHVAMDDLLDAIEDHSETVVHYFNQRTGEVGVWVDPDFCDLPQLDPDDPDQIEIPRLESHEAFAVMERFVDSLDDLDVQRQVRTALAGNSPFRGFRETIAGFPDLQDRWERTQREDLLQRAILFLDELGIAPQYELRQRPVPVAAPTGTPKEPRILLHHLLLLGSPNGKTELIDGRVDRCVRAPSPGKARKLFERLAREIMELQGLGWRRSAVDGLPVIEVGPFRLAVEGDVVWLGTSVPRELWNAFT